MGAGTTFDVGRDALPIEGASANGEWIDRGLVALFDVGRGIELIGNNRATTNTTLRGPGGVPTFSGTISQQYAHRDAYALTGAMSILILCDVDALSGYGALIAKQSTTTTHAPFELRLGATSTDSQINLVRANASTFTATNMAFVNLVAAGSRLVTIVFSMESAVQAPGCAVWINGQKTTYPASGSATVTDNGAAVWIGRRYDGATQLTGRIHFIGLMNRAADDEMAADFKRSPRSLYAPTRIWAPMSAGGGGAAIFRRTLSNRIGVRNV